MSRVPLQGDRAQSCFFDCFVHKKKGDCFTIRRIVLFFLCSQKNQIFSFNIEHLLKRRAICRLPNKVYLPVSNYKRPVHFQEKTKARARFCSLGKKEKEKPKRKKKKRTKITTRLAQPVCRIFLYKPKKFFFSFPSEEIKIAKRNLFFIFLTF